MAGMNYDDAAAERLEAVYLGPDVIAQRKDTIARLSISEGEHIIDIGSGPGFLAAEIAEVTGSSGHVLGVDISEQMVTRASNRNELSWLHFKKGDAASLPCEDNRFDVVVSTQVAEYVPDVNSFCSEVFRVLQPGGRALILATDWDAICWHSSDPERMDRILKAFAPHCVDSSLPRTLGARLRRAGLELMKVSFFPIINLDRYKGCYSEMVVPFIAAYVKGKGEISDEELSGWAQDLEDLNAKGEHFFSTGRFSLLVSKPT